MLSVIIYRPLLFRENIFNKCRIYSQIYMPVCLKYNNSRYSFLKWMQHNLFNPFRIPVQNIIQSPQMGLQEDIEEDVKLPPPGRTCTSHQAQVEWTDLMLRPELLRVIKQSGFQYPSQVQRLGIIEILQGKNLICQAKSGTGKTAVFVISLLQMFEPGQNNNYLPHQCLIMVPTRELAHQILKEVLHFSKYIKPKIYASAFFGGVSIESNVIELTNIDCPLSIIIATPGRLRDLKDRKLIVTSNCKYFILDECDKILDNQRMRIDFSAIYHDVPQSRQALMFSATATQASLQKTRAITGANTVEIKIENDKTILNGLIQFWVRLPQFDKFDKLKQLLDTLAFSQCIIFVNRIEKAIRLAQLLKKSLYNPISFHSSLKQEERIFNYDLFKQNSSKLLVATDVLGRGIDIKKVNLVINYDFPKQAETYLHRVGRAGRFGAKGLAVSFIKMDDYEGNSLENEDDSFVAVRSTYNNGKINLLPERILITDYI